MTAATSGRSLGTCASPSTMDAIVSTSYGVRFLLRAYERFSRLHFEVNSPSWLRTSCADVDLRSKSYVSGKRKPSSGSFLLPKPGTVRGLPVAAEYPSPETLTFRCASCSAIFATAVTRATIWARVNPSGKRMRNCRSWRIVVSGAALPVPPRPAAAAATSPAQRQRQADHDALYFLLAHEPCELGEPALGGRTLDDPERPRERPGRVGNRDSCPRGAVVQRQHLHAGIFTQPRAPSRRQARPR